MKVNISWPGTAVTAALRTYVEQQLGLALGRFGEGISTVNVRFSSQEGKSHCDVRVALRVREVQVEHAHLDPMRAIDHAAARLSERVALAIDGAA